MTLLMIYFSNLFTGTAMSRRAWLVLITSISLLYISCASVREETGLVTTIDDSPGPASEQEVETLVAFEGFDDKFARAAEQSVVGNYIGRGRAARIVIYFDFDSAFLALDGRKALDGIITDIKNTLTQNNKRALNIRVEGHTDERGSNEYNLALGQRRADSVARYMVLQGVTAPQLEAVSYGETRPVNSGSGEIAWQENRRVEINY